MSASATPPPNGPIFAPGALFERCHASTLVRCASGRFLAAWFAGTDEGRRDVAIWGCRSSGASWTPPVRLAKVRREGHWNPVLFLAPDLRIHLFFKVGRSPEHWATWHMDSRDEGDTWSEPAPLTAGRGPVRNKPIVLADGAWLAPLSTESSRGWDALTDRTDDGGATWVASPVPLDHANFPDEGVIQPALWESTPPHVHMLLRSSCGSICRSDSADGGRTWSAVVRTSLPNNNSAVDVVRLKSGTLVLAYNPVAGNWAARTPLSIAVSKDNGKTWSEPRDIEAGSGEFSYPAIISLDDTRIAMTYTQDRKSIRFWAGPAAFAE